MISIASTQLRTLPLRTERGPAALVATMPPDVAKAPEDGSGGSRRPKGRAAAVSSAHGTEAPAQSLRRGQSGALQWNPWLRSTTTPRPPRPTDPHRDRSPSRSRVGRVGRAAPPRERGLLRASRTLLPLCRPDDRYRHGGGGGAHLPAWPATRHPLGDAAPHAVARPGGGVRGDLGVVRDPAPFLLWGRARAPRGLARAGALSPPDEPHLVCLSGVRQAGLGGARGHRRVQHPRRAPPPDGGQGRVAGSHPALSLQAGARWGAGDRRALRRPGIRSNPRTARAAGDPRAPPPRGRRGSVRAGHDDRAPRRGWPVAGARAHHAPPERTVPRRDARPRHHGGVGEGLGGGVGRPSSWAAFGTPNFCFSLSTNRCAIL